MRFLKVRTECEIAQVLWNYQYCKVFMKNQSGAYVVLKNMYGSYENEWMYTSELQHDEKLIDKQLKTLELQEYQRKEKQLLAWIKKTS